MLEHGKVRWWLGDNAKIVRYDPESTVLCLSTALPWEQIEALVFKGEYSLNGSRGGYCEDCLRKLGLIW